MIEKVMFPLQLDGKTLSGTFFTTQDITIDEQTSIIKELFPYVIEPMHIRLSIKSMSPSVYNWSVIDDITICSLITTDHIIKLKCEKDGDMMFSVYQTSDSERISYYNVLDLINFLSDKVLDDLIYLFKNDTEIKNYDLVMKSMFSVLSDLLFNRFFK